MVWSCLPFIRSGQNHLARHSERGKKTRRTKEEVGRQHQGMDRPGVQQVPEGSGEQGKMEKTGCKIICGAPTTLTVKGLMMMMMMICLMHTSFSGRKASCRFQSHGSKCGVSMSVSLVFARGICLTRRGINRPKHTLSLALNLCVRASLCLSLSRSLSPHTHIVRNETKKNNTHKHCKSQDRRMTDRRE